MHDDHAVGGLDPGGAQRQSPELDRPPSQRASRPGGTPDDSAHASPKRRLRRVVIDDGEQAKPAELLATQFPARRPNRRRSPRLTPPARPDRHAP